MEIIINPFFTTPPFTAVVKSVSLPTQKAIIPAIPLIINPLEILMRLA